MFHAGSINQHEKKNKKTSGRFEKFMNKVREGYMQFDFFPDKQKQSLQNSGYISKLMYPELL
jgi:hypothetical protein